VIAAMGARSPDTTRRHASIEHTAEQRCALFGEMHLHTIMSLGAWKFETKITPDQAYKFGRGETVMVCLTKMAEHDSLLPYEGILLLWLFIRAWKPCVTLDHVVARPN
jgi:hypothetical protein